LIDRMKIGIVGLAPNAGAGFIATSLARVLVEQRNCHPAVLELGHGGLYDCLGMDKRFSGRQYFSFHNAVLQDKSIRGRENELDGVNWMLLPPEESASSIELARKLRLLHTAMGDVILCQLGGLSGEELWSLLWEMDKVLVIIDPLPSRMLAGYKLLCSLRISELPIIYIINKYNAGVNRRELLDFLKLKKLTFLPLVEQEAVYAAEYTCRVVYDMANARKQLEKPLKELLMDIFAVNP
jgi:hypothetical protein